MVATLCKGRLEWIKIGGGDTSKYVTETNSQQGLHAGWWWNRVQEWPHGCFLLLILLLFFLSILMPCRCALCTSKQERSAAVHQDGTKSLDFCLTSVNSWLVCRDEDCVFYNALDNGAYCSESALNRIICLYIENVFRSNIVTQATPHRVGNHSYWPTLDALSRRWFRPFMFSRL
jgi:hypothetical protein